MKELLLSLCQYPFDEKNRETLSRLIRDVRDWNELVRLINAHGIIALAAYNIKEAGLEKEIPADGMSFLENGYRQSVVRNFWLKERWKEVNEILNNAGIKHILLKGMALEHTIYGARGLRQMNDTDILVSREEAAEAWQVLQKNGFSYNTPKSPLHFKMMRELSNHMPALYKDGYALEIHTHLFDHETTRLIGNPDYFKNSVEISIDKQKALILTKELHLKYLFSHFERHTGSGECQLRLFADLKILDKNNPVEFPEQFISYPNQKGKGEFRKAAYKSKVKFISPKYRPLFILGDLVPSVKWMKERYKCSGLKAIFYYPHRMGKLWWLM
jgi:hypothetical protein